MSRLAQFFQDSDGQLSSMRLLFLAWGFGTLIVWLIISLHTMTLAPMPWTITSFIASLVGGKVLQSWTDNTSATLPQPVVVPPVVTTQPVVVAPPVIPPVAETTTTTTTTTTQPTVSLPVTASVTPSGTPVVTVP